ncbi:hypothetical protein [Nostoc sp. FACHB-892]|uniref:hypothetical protein n=1 Tax=Nostoc sp. FACHB-892 TaxID=2692843 RepID=UPI001F548879|nr:hypothetical protein [Nostoc sp. FACHB-892]
MTNQTNAPPAVDYAPLELQAELIAMQELTIEEFLTVGQSQIPETQQELHVTTFRKKSKSSVK